ncbi:MAG: glycosyltransferase family 9 protein, partial [Melioribacteraceae bacterium]
IEEKNWHSDNYRELFFLLDQEDYIVLCQGTSRQRGRIEELIGGLNNVFNIAGELTLSQSAALISLCDLYIGNDSGFTHIAKALNKTIIAIIGGGSYGSFFPYVIRDNEYLLYYDVDCKGCEWRCIHKERICIDRITAEEVYDLAVRVLK